MKSLKIIVNDIEKVELNIDQITQICGKNSQVKLEIFNIIKRYFNKKSDIEGFDIKLLLDNEEISKSHFNHFCIYNENDLIEEISFVKDSILFNYIKFLCDDLQVIDLLYDINDNLDRIDKNLIAVLDEKFDNLFSLEHKEFKIVDFMKNISIVRSEENDYYKLTNYERFLIYFQLIKIRLEENPGSYLFSIWDIDRLLTKNEFSDLYPVIKELMNNYDISFFIYSGLEQFIMEPMELLESLNVLNDIIFSFCSFDILKDSIERNYPTNIILDKKELALFLYNNAVNLYCSKYVYKYSRDDVIIKVLNSMYNIECSVDKQEIINKLELDFLKT